MTTPTPGATTARDALAGLAALLDGTELRAVRDERQASRVQAVEASSDPQLTADAQRQRRTDGEAEADRAALARIDEHAARVETLAGRVRAWADAPDPEPSESAALLADQRAGRGWDRLRSRLDTGTRPPAGLLRDSDPDELRGARENLPAWLDAQQGAPSVRAAMREDGPGADPSALLDLIDRRAAVLAEGEQGQRARARWDLADTLRVLDARTEGARLAVRDPRRAINAALAGDAAMSEVRARRETAGQDDGATAA